MVFSSAIFLFLFLPLTLLCVLCVRKQFRNLILLIASLIFYAWGEGELVVIMVGSIFFNYLFGLAIDHFSEQWKRKTIVLLSVIFNLSLLAFFKYANFFIDNINILFDKASIPPVEIAQIHLPIGISFFTFQAMSYVIDVYRKETDVQKNPINIALYITLFPQLIAGPIVRYHDVAKQIIHRTLSINKFYSGVQRFIIGLGKKILIANTMASVTDKIFSLPENEITISLSWLAIITYSLQIYFDFSGYSDMAIGLGRMFGFEFLENFNYPYIGQSIQNFWRRWHISLSTWFRDYLYIPLGGNKKGAARTYVNLLIVFFLTGLWHGASWNFVIWGMFHGFFLVIERLGGLHLINKMWRPFRHIYTLIIVLVGWVFFRAETLSMSISMLKNMSVIMGKSRSSIPVIQFMGRLEWTVLILGLIAAMPIFPAIKQAMHKYKIKSATEASPILFTSLSYLYAIYIFTIFILSIMSLSSNTYNPFIYFRF